MTKSKITSFGFAVALIAGFLLNVSVQPVATTYHKSTKIQAAELANSMAHLKSEAEIRRALAQANVTFPVETSTTSHDVSFLPSASAAAVCSVYTNKSKSCVLYCCSVAGKMTCDEYGDC